MIKEALLKKCHNRLYVERYCRFIQYYRDNPQSDFDTVHHILPKGKHCWPEYANLRRNPWNAVKLTNRQHFIAHLLLWKALPHNPTVVYSANMMRNFWGEKRNTSRLYESLMKDVGSTISKANKGLKRSDEVKKEISDRLKNTLVVFDNLDPDKTPFRINKDDPGYDPSRHLFYRTGYMHDEETKQKIGRPGKIQITDGVVNTCIGPDEDIPDGFHRGVTSEKLGKHGSFYWYYNPENGEQGRFKKDKQPDDWLRGRPSNTGKENKGFAAANNKTNVIDLVRKKSTKVGRVDRTFMGPQSGKSTAKTKVFLVDNTVFTNKKLLCKKYPYLKNIEDVIIKAPHYNMSDEIRIFHAENEGLTFSELGYKMIPLSDYEHSEGRTIYWP